jgi:hypothetical protein
MLFCPFCREAFDDVTRCPEHDVELVTLRELARFAQASASDDAPLGLWSPRRSRGLVAAGAVLSLIAFVCPFGSLEGDVARSSTLLSLARGHALRLWIVPLSALTLLLMLYRRRRPAALRAARVAALFVSLLPSAVVFYTWLGAGEAARALASRSAQRVVFHAGIGAWLVWGSGVLLIWGSVWLGVRRKPVLR